MATDKNNDKGNDPAARTLSAPAKNAPRNAPPNDATPAAGSGDSEKEAKTRGKTKDPAGDATSKNAPNGGPRDARPGGRGIPDDDPDGDRKTGGGETEDAETPGLLGRLGRSLLGKAQGVFKALPKKRLIAAGLAAVLVGAGAAAVYETFVAGPREKLEFETILTRLSPLVRAEENSTGDPPKGFPGPADEDDPEETILLKEGAEAFFKEDYGKASESFRELNDLLPEESFRILPLMGAANLRNMNFSLALECFEEAKVAKRPEDFPPDPIADTATDLGMALALFNMGDLENALPPARAAHNARIKLLGHGNPQTLSAANILAGILIGVGDGLTAEAILEPGLRAAMDKGLTTKDPVLVASLNILALSHELRGFGEPEGPDDEGDVPGPTAAGSPGPGNPGKATDPGEAELSSLLSSSPDREWEYSGRRATGKAGSAGLQDTGPAVAGSGSGRTSGGMSGGTGTADATEATGADASGASSAGGTPSPEPDPAVARAERYRELLGFYNELAGAFPRSPVLAPLLRETIATLAKDAVPGAEPCADPGDVPERNELWTLCVSLADSLIVLGSFEEGFKVTQELIDWEDSGERPGAHLVFRNAAFQNHERGSVSGAEEFLELALATLGEKEELEPSDVAFIILRTVTLADLILSQGKNPLEAEMELTSTVTFLESKIGKNKLESYPESPMLFWYLARVLRDEGRIRDSRNAFNRARKAALAASRERPENKSETDRLVELVESDRKSKKGHHPNFPLSPRIFFQAEKLYQGKYPRLPSPQVMRLERAALQALGRGGDFLERVDWAIAFSEKESPPGSNDHLRYRALKLKHLESLKDYPAFQRELDETLASAVFADPASGAVFASRARSYEARVKLAAGDREGAAASYRNALALLEGHDAPREKEAIAGALRDLGPTPG
ncbi:MAG: hypothetical protein LBF41_00655 [Deltaproteobacteria bacterium]|jgi:tetratricopeptide (TPR) repeat protein|nr:hypothetical protein [Deltaproteobacteria bacterium]